jgi:hypothetical protein
LASFYICLAGGAWVRSLLGTLFAYGGRCLLGLLFHSIPVRQSNGLSPSRCAALFNGEMFRSSPTLSHSKLNGPWTLCVKREYSKIVSNK